MNGDPEAAKAPEAMTDPELLAARQSVGAECGDLETPECAAIAAELERRGIDF